MSRSGLAVLLAGSGVACAIPASAASSIHGFCPVLKMITADARQGFTAVRGEKLALGWDDGGGDDEVRYAATLRLPGSLGCDVDQDRNDGEDVLTAYTCWFPAAPSKSVAVKALAARVVACLGSASGDRVSAGHGAAVMTADITRKDFVISVSAGAAPTVVVQIGGK